jgi:hypothetical protein
VLDLTASLSDQHSDLFVRSSSLPDSPELEREMAEAFPAYEPTADELDAEYRRVVAGQRPADWLDVPCQGCGAAIYVQSGGVPLCTACTRPPTGAAMFPEIPTWDDTQLIVAIELADRREPGLNLHPVGNLPDRHDAFLHECSAELVRRLESRGVRLAA